ncbi:MAG: ANTAR domain-containing protein [Treponema sp.]|nr:ANTAR domain-containing protein [Treponema sp.]
MESSGAENESVLIVTTSVKSVSLFSEAFAAASINQIKVAASASEAQKILLEKKYDIVIVDAPLSDEGGENLARSIAASVKGKLRQLQDENAKLKQKIEDIRIIDRAKCMLISYLSLSEQESHRFIEKQAMDLRTTKRVIAEGILKTYAN